MQKMKDAGTWSLDRLKTGQSVISSNATDDNGIENADEIQVARNIRSAWKLDGIFLDAS